MNLKSFEKQSVPRHRIWLRLASCGFMAFMLLFLAVLARAWAEGKFNSVESFRNYIEGYGALAPILLILFQAAQVVVPVLPGMLGCAAGTMMLGCAGGFLCNYIGISAGSIIAFQLARKYGAALVRALFKGKRYSRWAEWAGKSRSYVAFVFLAMLLPLFPDDYICYLTGLTKMSRKKFVLIILLGKPWCILAYCIGFSFIK